jgi:organic radical activating enzyme
LIKVYNYFPTIQGEGRSVGRPIFLLRLWGCNYTCRWCDINKVSQGTVPYKVIEYDNEEFIKLIDTIEETIRKYNIETLLITGGEPTLYFTNQNKEIFNTLSKYFRIIEIETNGSCFTKDFSYLSPYEYFDEFYGQVRFNVSPKLNIDAYRRYSFIKTLDDIIDFYKDNVTKLVKYYDITACKGASFKFVYEGNNENDILTFINELVIPKKSIFILPYTPIEYINDQNKFFKEFKLSRLKTVDFCMRHGFRYSPREHIELYYTSDFEHEEVKEKELT